MSVRGSGITSTALAAISPTRVGIDITLILLDTNLSVGQADSGVLPSSRRISYLRSGTHNIPLPDF